MVPFIQTNAGINMVIDGKPVSVATQDKHFDAIVQALKAGAGADAIKAVIETELVRVTAATKLTDTIEVKGGELYYEGEAVHSTLADRIIKMLDEGFNLTAMVKFLENLMANPSSRVVENLYAFLEQGKNAITEDGHFLAYKAVRSDFLDIHSGTFDNSVGKVVSMPRRKVDENKDNTCSNGLHVCSFDYLPHFANANGHVMICKVNPANVVAIPADYHNTKMRVCAYEVIGEFEGYYKVEERSDVLGAASVLSGFGVKADYPFSVTAIYEEGSQPVHVDNFLKLSQAAAKLDELLDDSSISEVFITNRESVVELDRQTNPNYLDSDSSDDDNGAGADAEDDFDYEVRVFVTLSDYAAKKYYVDYSSDDLPEAKIEALDVDLEANYLVRVVNCRTENVELTFRRE